MLNNTQQTLKLITLQCNSANMILKYDHIFLFLPRKIRYPIVNQDQNLHNLHKHVLSFFGEKNIEINIKSWVGDFFLAKE